MKEYQIPLEIRSESYRIAQGRNNVAKSFNRPDGKFFEEYSSLNVDWQGAIAEVFLKKLYPQLVNSQPLVMNSIKTLGADFMYRGKGIEVKCNRIPFINRKKEGAYTKFWVNVDRFNKKKHLFETLFCCGINSSPEKSTKFYIFGWINKGEVEIYPIESSYSSPAYTIPFKDIKNIDDFFENRIP